MNEDKVAKNYLADKTCATCQYALHTIYGHINDVICSYDHENKEAPKELTCEHWKRRISRNEHGKKVASAIGIFNRSMK